MVWLMSRAVVDMIVAVLGIEYEKYPFYIYVVVLSFCGLGLSPQGLAMINLA